MSPTSYRTAPPRDTEETNYTTRYPPLKPLQLFVARSLMAIWIVIALNLLSIQARQSARIAPPPSVECARDHLTVYTGRVSRWSRALGQSSLTIATDEDTIEVVTLKHPRTDDARQWFLLHAKPFQASDWSRIESRKGTLRDRMRATAWVCDDGRQPIIDWQPPSKD